MRYILIILAIIAIVVIALALTRPSTPEVNIQQDQPEEQQPQQEEQTQREQETQTQASVIIRNIRYEPSSITVNRGQTIVFTNRDNVTHTVTADNGRFDLRLNPGQTANLTIDDTGTFSYYCRIHPDMLRGSITVR